MLRFSIRDLILVTLVVGLVVGWWVDRSRLAALAQEAESFRTLSEALAKDPQLLAKFSIALCELLVERLRDTARRV